MPNEISLTAYKCAVCHKVYTNREEAIISGVYFKEKRIVLIRNDDDTNYERDSIPIKYCPFCGREL